jgi:hypothetical protein
MVSGISFNRFSPRHRNAVFVSPAWCLDQAVSRAPSREELGSSADLSPGFMAQWIALRCHTRSVCVVAGLTNLPFRTSHGGMDCIALPRAHGASGGGTNEPAISDLSRVA